MAILLCFSSRWQRSLIGQSEVFKTLPGFSTVRMRVHEGNEEEDGNHATSLACSTHTLTSYALRWSTITVSNIETLHDARSRKPARNLALIHTLQCSAPHHDDIHIFMQSSDHASIWPSFQIPTWIHPEIISRVLSSPTQMLAETRMLAETVHAK